MRYTLEMDIAVPRATVVRLFDDPDNWSQWQESLLRWEAADGTRRENGAKTRLFHKFGRREVEMVETIESTNLPEEMTCTYVAPGAWNRVVYRFTERGPNETHWEFDTEFRCGGFLRIMALLMPGMFRRASLRDMTSFKRFAGVIRRHCLQQQGPESGGDARSALISPARAVTCSAILAEACTLWIG